MEKEELQRGIGKEEFGVKERERKRTKRRKRRR